MRCRRSIVPSLVELPPVAAQPAHGQQALVAVAEGDERARADDADDLAVELGLPAALEELALEQEARATSSASRSMAIASRSRAERHSPSSLHAARARGASSAAADRASSARWQTRSG